MMAATMFPSLAPTTALYARMTRQRGWSRPLLFAAAYLLVWGRRAATWGAAGVLIALAITVAALPNDVPGLVIPGDGQHAMHAMQAMP